MKSLVHVRNQKRTMLEVLQSPLVPQAEKDKILATFKFCHLPRWFRKLHRKEYPLVDWDKVTEFERKEAMKLKKEFR